MCHQTMIPEKKRAWRRKKGNMLCKKKRQPKIKKAQQKWARTKKTSIIAICHGSVQRWTVKNSQLTKFIYKLCSVPYTYKHTLNLYVSTATLLLLFFSTVYSVYFIIIWATKAHSAMKSTHTKKMRRRQIETNNDIIQRNILF